MGIVYLLHNLCSDRAERLEDSGCQGINAIMTAYFAIVHKDPDSAFGVTFPDLPGCFSAADTLADVIPNARAAMALWLEDGAPSQPRSADEIAAEFADDLGLGAFLITVTRTPTADDNGRFG